MRHSGMLLFALLGATSATAEAAPSCLPANLGREDTALRLGAIAGAPVLCVERERAIVGCWDVNPKSGKLAARAIKALPGRSVVLPLDAKGCVDGYCVTTPAPPPEKAFVATSTDGKHVLLGPWNAGTAVIFDAKTKQLVRTFNFSGDTGDTIIGNIIVGLLYIGDTIYARGADAGPNEIVYAMKDDGTHLGILSDGSDPPSMSIDRGAASAFDADNLALTDAYFQRLVVFSAKDQSRTVRKRRFSLGPCTQDDLDDDAMIPKPKCKKYFATAFQAYIGAEVVALTGGDLLVALSAPSLGQVVILDGKKLVEKRRLRLPTCRR